MTAPTRCDCTDTPRLSAACICHAGSTAVQALATIRRTLALCMLPQQIRQWMNTPCARLDDRPPMSLVMSGSGDDVIREARTIAAGSIR
jgi:hypothetical protein